MDEQIIKNRYLVASPTGLIQLLATNFINRGYEFYFHGTLRAEVDALRIDHKLHSLYDLDLSKYQRAKRKKAGLSSVKYLRYKRDYLFLITRGQHQIWQDHKGLIYPFDERMHARKLILYGYVISRRDGRVNVSIDRARMSEYRAYFSDIAVNRSKTAIEQEINNLPYERYRGVVLALASLFELVNRLRGRAGLSKLDTARLRDKRKPVQTYVTDGP